MKRFIAMRRAVHRITNVEDFICTLNVRRLFYTAFLMFAVELIRFAGSFFSRDSSFLSDGSAFVFSLTLVTMGLILARYDFLLVHPELVRSLCLAFWLFALLSMTPRFASDVQVYRQTGYCAPLHAILLSMLLIVIPFWERQDIIAVFSAFIVIHSTVLLVCHAGTRYALCGTGVLLGAFLLGYSVQNQSMSMILRLKQETAMDSLTGILNRKGGMEKIHTMMELSRRYNGTIALYMIDIDLFKPYNDHYGHIEGDEALRKVAKAIAKVFARSTDVVCRYGGEEFVVCALAEGANEPGSMAAAVCGAVEALRIPIPNQQIAEHLTVSVGLTTFSPNKDNGFIDIVTLIDRADRALYHAKNMGRNGVARWTEEGVCVPVRPARRPC
ncbi:MAG TPA: GGDEF domain-containing protein [Clostridia bacterium]|nr:GGDEF domain-containing protein [Clostridia bacterium]